MGAEGEALDLRCVLEARVADARSPRIEKESVDLVVTSPPYPMVQMWDEVFSSWSEEIAAGLAEERGLEVFERMHHELDRVWAACAAALRPGGFLCINIGDATRRLGANFALYPNHARIQQSLLQLGLTLLPGLLWHKPTNAPTKFMGSGMLPAGAYVTYEREHILIARKGPRRSFRGSDQRLRQASAYFWEERNHWFSDLWQQLPGCAQQMQGPRQRSGAFPLEIPRRLILMYSCLGDRVLDPFCGTGTTLWAAGMLGRSGLGLELEPELVRAYSRWRDEILPLGRSWAAQRLRDHRAFTEGRAAAGKPLSYVCQAHQVPVMTRQEQRLRLLEPQSIQGGFPGCVTLSYGLHEPEESAP